jgi:cell wall-associated NlpC family hydrolase
VRAAPRDDAEQVTQLLRGEPVQVEERQDGWVLVVTAYNYSGWAREELLEEGQGELPPLSAASALDNARSYLGAPYEWGGMTERGIDCSGLVHMAYRRLGRLVPRDAWQQEEAGRRVDDPEPGDVFVYGDPGKLADHVALWVGGGRILHATGSDSLGVVEEAEPPELAGRRRSAVRF